jgi:hypothetical protein
LALLKHNLPINVAPEERHVEKMAAKSALAALH